MSFKLTWRDYSRPERPAHLTACLLTLEWPCNGRLKREVYPAVYTETRGFLLTCPDRAGKGLKTPQETGVFTRIHSWALLPIPYIFDEEEDLLT